MGLFLVVLYLYDLESRAFLHVGIVAFFAFPVHYFLPMRMRRPFFAAVSLFCLALVFGFQLERWTLAGLVQAGWIVGLGACIIGLCHLPAPFIVRASLLLMTGGVLTAMRAGAIPTPWSAAIWPVFASMFMFRTALYLHALKHDKQPIKLVDALCYFFMLPNPCFPLFPVVDFQTLRRSYFDARDRHDIYLRGASWMFRGLTHLLAYRFVYHYLVIDVADVDTLPRLQQYILWPFLMYLRISGQFHVIVGMLHLFGFRLPETHRLYYLSSSFTDFWRRINIYWKDFMMKLLFYPSYVRLKHWGPTKALVASTLVVFFATWLLHSYQWFWIRGSWLLTWNDALFWATLAVLVVLNALYESAHGRFRKLSQDRAPWRVSALTALKTIAAFCAICLLWSFWSASSISQWLSAFEIVDQGQSLEPTRALLLFLLLCVTIGGSALLATASGPQPFRLLRSTMSVTLGCVALIVAYAPQVRDALPVSTRDVVTTLAQSDLSRRDFANLERGYYEELLDLNRFNPELVEIYRTRPDDWALGLQDQFVAVDDPPFFELKPNFEGRGMGVTVRTNSWGMRDREYAKAKPAGVTRVALVGASFVEGVGVEEEHTFAARVEDRLNATQGPATYEVLNFGVTGYTQLQVMGSVENKVLEFSPDVVIYVEHGDALTMTMKGLVNYVRNGRYKHFDFFVGLAAEAGVAEDMDPAVIRKRLQPVQERLLSEIYSRMVNACMARKARPVWLYVPRPEEWDRGPSDLEVRLAREAGFEVLILDNVYPTDSLSSLWLARWDHHPDAQGHQMIADRMYEVLRESGVLTAVDAPEQTDIVGN